MAWKLDFMECRYNTYAAKVMRNHYLIYQSVKWGASFPWSSRPKSARSSKETTTVGKKHPTLPSGIDRHTPPSSSGKSYV